MKRNIYIIILTLAFSIFIAKEANAGAVINKAPAALGLISGLVGYWSFDGPDMAGTKAYDRSGQGNNGTLTAPAPAFVDTGLVARYYIDEAASGQAPTAVLDESGVGAAFNLTIESYGGTNLNYTEISGNRGLESTATDGTQRAARSISDTSDKVRDNLFGAQKMTMEVIARIDGLSASNGRIFAINIGTDNPTLGFGGTSATNAQFFFKAEGEVEGVLMRTWDPGTARAVWHIVVDTTLATANDRIKIYKDGTVITPTVNANPAQNAVLDDAASQRLFMLNRGTAVDGFDRSMDGVLFYAALYAAAFAQADVTTNFDILTADDDKPAVSQPQRTIGRIGQALEFDGSNGFMDIGAGPASVHTVSFWVYPETTTEFFVNVTGTTDYISASAGTISATGFSSPTIYVDGAVSSTIVAKQWQHVAVTTATAENASNLDIGRTQDTNVMDGLIDDVRIYDRALSPDEIRRLYKIGSTFTINKSMSTGSLSDGLVGYWSFNGPDMAGVTAYDRSGQGNNGTLTNGPVRKIGRIGQALDFDGSNDYVDLGNPASLRLTGAMAVSAWVQQDALDDFGAFISKQGTAGDRGWSFHSRDVNPDTYAFQISSDGTALTSAESSAADGPVIGEWTHLAGVYRPSTSVELYKNGVKVAETVTSVPASQFDSSHNVNIGRRPDVLFIFNGTLDDIRVYNRALSADEVRRLYNMGR